MTETQEKQADFDRSNTASARALADKAGLTLELPDTATATILGVTAPVFDQTDQATGKLIARGLSDSIGLIAAHHNAALHQHTTPAGRHAATLFNAMERARCEALGARKYSGVANNTAVFWHNSQTRGNFANHDIEHLLLIISTLTREALKLKINRDKRLQSLIMNWTDNKLVNSPLWHELAEKAHDQKQFGRTSLKIIDQIDKAAFSPQVSSEFITEPNDDEDLTSDEEAVTEDSTDSEQDNAPDEDTTLTVELRDEEDRSTETLLAPPEDSDNDDNDLANRDAPVSADAEQSGQAGGLTGGGYTVWSTANDEIVTARSMCTANELTELRAALDQQIHRHARVVGRLSGRLQRVLLAQQQRHWKFDLQEGVLDTTRLTRVVTDPMSALTFKAESDIEFKNTTVTLLVDNSKSMLGKPIAIAAACSDLLSQTLERCGVSVEILGFTTTQLHGGEAFEQWQQNGSASNPGRLNGLRHIIYKSADTPYRRARKNFGLMLLKDLLKQNIDGEALLWAHDRLLRRPEQRKILMVISDGAPIDTSTMAANKNNYLTDHLREVVTRIENRGEVELLAIGIGHDVTQYYRRAMKIMDARDLSKSMLNHLSDLFT